MLSLLLSRQRPELQHIVLSLWMMGNLSKSLSLKILRDILIVLIDAILLTLGGQASLLKTVTLR